MTSFSGFTNAALQIGIEAILIKPVRGLYGITTDDGSQLPDIIAQATIEEIHRDELEITQHPVEQGAAISDHAFKHPAEVTLKMGWSNSPSSSALVNTAASLGAFAAGASSTFRKISNVVGVLEGGVAIADSIQSSLNGQGTDQINSIYEQLRELQAKRALFVIYTGKRVYTNMLCKSLSTQTDAKTANALFITMTCKQVILVNTQTYMLPKSTQANPAATMSTVNKGVKQLVPSGGLK